MKVFWTLLLLVFSLPFLANAGEQEEIFELENARRMLHKLEVKMRVNPILRFQVAELREQVAAREARLGRSSLARPLGPREVEGFAARAFNGTNMAVYRGFGVYQTPQKWRQKRDRYFGVVEAVYDDGTVVIREPNGRVAPFGNIGAAMFDDETSEFQFRPLTTYPSRR